MTKLNVAARETFRDQLVAMRACSEAVEWVGDRTEVEAWRECERADWMLWLAGRRPWGEHSEIMRAACACARTVLHLVKPGEDRPRLAIEAAEIWADVPSEENREAVRAAAARAYAAEYVAAAADAAGWANAAAEACAANAACAASEACAEEAEWAFEAAAYAACAEAEAAESLADLVRQHIAGPSVA